MLYKTEKIINEMIIRHPRNSYLDNSSLCQRKAFPSPEKTILFHSEHRHHVDQIVHAQFPQLFLTILPCQHA